MKWKAWAITHLSGRRLAASAAAPARERAGGENKMKRTTIFRERNGQLVVVREHLAKQPSGNAAQRKKAIRSGWHPEWVQEGRPALLSGYDINYIFSGDVTLEPQFPGGVSSTDDDLIPNEVHYVEPEFEEV